MSETLSETCGLRMFMAFPFRSAAALGRAPALLAAVLPEEVGESAKRHVVGRVEEGLALAASCHEPRVHHSVEVVVQRRPGDVELLLQLGRRDPIGASLYDRSQDRKTGFMTEGGELLGVALDGLHVYVSRSV